MVLFFEIPNSIVAADLEVDEAIINVTSNFSKKIFLYTLSSECYKCPFSRFKNISKGLHQFKFDTTFDTTWKFYEIDKGELIHTKDNSEICKLNPNLGQFGVYNVLVDPLEKCTITTDTEPVNINLSLLLILLPILLFVVYKVISNIINKRALENSSGEPSAPPLDENDKKIVKPRLKSLDTFRGLTIALMIFVNSGGGKYWWIEHATWNGINIADFVFPFFLWIMGVCIPMSIKSQIRKGVPKKEMIYNVLKRSLTLFAIGLCLNSVAGSNFETLRIFGVLQRFGIAYFFVTTCYIVFIKTFDVLPQNRIKQIFLDIFMLLSQWILILGIISVYLILIFYLPVPDCPTGYFGPGGNHLNGSYKNCIGGVTGYIDRTILGISHIYQHPTARYIYNSMPFDPEGIFGCIPTIFQTFFGVQCGVILIVFTDWKQRVIRWLVWGTCLGLIGGILCNFEKEDGWIPINKNLWSLSYVLVTCCCAFYILTIFYVLIDVKPIWGGSPFIYSGMNAIIMYIGHTVTHKMLPWHWSFGSMNTHFILLFESLWNTILWMFIAYYLYRKKIFYSV